MTPLFAHTTRAPVRTWKPSFRSRTSVEPLDARIGPGECADQVSSIRTRFSIMICAKARGLELIAPDKAYSFLDDTPTAVLMRHVLGAVSQFDKGKTVTKVKVARDASPRSSQVPSDQPRVRAGRTSNPISLRANASR